MRYEKPTMETMEILCSVVTDSGNPTLGNGGAGSGGEIPGGGNEEW